MSFPSNAFRLEGAAVRNSYAAGRDLAGAVSTVELRVTDQQRQITSLAQQLAQANAETRGAVGTSRGVGGEAHEWMTTG